MAAGTGLATPAPGHGVQHSFQATIEPPSASYGSAIDGSCSIQGRSVNSSDLRPSPKASPSRPSRTERQNTGETLHTSESATSHANSRKHPPGQRPLDRQGTNDSLKSHKSTKSVVNAMGLSQVSQVFRTLLNGSSSDSLLSLRERRRQNLNQLSGVDDTEARDHVQAGSFLRMHRPEIDEFRPGFCRALLGRLASCCRRCRKVFAVIVKDDDGFMELRWDPQKDRAFTRQAQGRMCLNAVRLVTATGLKDAHVDRWYQMPLEHVNKASPSHREFRVICTDSTLKFRTTTREEMRLWVCALLKFSGESQGSVKRCTHATDATLCHYVNRQFRAADRDGSASVQRDELFDLFNQMGIALTEEYANEVFDEFDTNGSDSLEASEFIELFHTFIVKDPLFPWFQRYASVSTDNFNVNGSRASRVLPPEGFTVQGLCSNTTFARGAQASLPEGLDGQGLGGVIKVGEGVPITAPRESAAPSRITLARSRSSNGEARMLMMSAADFQLFLEKEQGEDGHTFGSQRISDCISRLSEPSVVEYKGVRYLTEAGFSELLSRKANAVFDPARSGCVWQDMTRPLSHYWISSSHNTYLQGDQLVGQASLEQYIDVLIRGCRCVEIDVWEDGKCEPIVTHGWTATTKLSFQDVVRVCRDYGFVASPYPLVLSLEVHASRRCLARMGEILVDVLGNQLLRLPAGGGGLERCGIVSPEEAKNKIIVKGKVPPKVCALWKRNHTLTSTMTSLSQESVEAEDEEEEFEEDEEEDNFPTETFERSWRENQRTGFGRAWRCCTSPLRRFCCRRFHAEPRTCEIPQMARADGEDPGFLTSSSMAKDKVKRASNNSNGIEVSRLSSVHASASSEKVLDYANTLYLISAKLPKQPKTGCEDTQERLGLHSCNIVSFSEEKAHRFIDRVGLEAARDHHNGNLSRVYPKSTRVNSTNFDPLPMWLAGFQMVALNYQNEDLPNIINEGLFRHENGGAGYVLKPSEVSGGSDNGNHVMTQLPSVTSGSDAVACTLEVTVLSAHNLPKPRRLLHGEVIDPMVRVSIYGADCDCRSVDTRRIVDNGFNPRWEEKFVFEVRQPSVAILAFQVLHVEASADAAKTVLRWRSSWRRMITTEERVAANAFPLAGIRPGVRWAELTDWRHQHIEHCGLLLEVRMHGPWVELTQTPRLDKSTLSRGSSSSLDEVPSERSLTEELVATPEHVILDVRPARVDKMRI